MVTHSVMFHTHFTMVAEIKIMMKQLKLRKCWHGWHFTDSSRNVSQSSILMSSVCKLYCQNVSCHFINCRSSNNFSKSQLCLFSLYFSCLQLFIMLRKHMNVRNMERSRSSRMMSITCWMVYSVRSLSLHVALGTMHTSTLGLLTIEGYSKLLVQLF